MRPLTGPLRRDASPVGRGAHRRATGGAFAGVNSPRLIARGLAVGTGPHPNPSPASGRGAKRAPLHESCEGQRRSPSPMKWERGWGEGRRTPEPPQSLPQSPKTLSPALSRKRARECLLHRPRLSATMLGATPTHQRSTTNTVTLRAGTWKRPLARSTEASLRSLPSPAPAARCTGCSRQAKPASAGSSSVAGPAPAFTT